MARGVALAAAVAVSLLAVSGAGGAATQQTPKRGGTVVVNGAGEQPCLNVLLDACLAGAFNDVVEPVLRGAYRLLPDLSLQPYLARAEFTTRLPITLTYRIRAEARWSDGIPVTARDFVFTHEAFVALVPDSFHAAHVRSVRAVDAKTVRVVLKMRFADWRALFSPVLPWHALRGEDLTKVWIDRIDNPKTGQPIGNGPFLFRSWDRGERLTLGRNPRYWGRHAAYLDRLVVRYLATADTPGELAEALRSGQYDVGVGTVDGDLVRALSAVSGSVIRFAPGRTWEHLELRIGARGHPALRVKSVRQALAYGIDRDALVRELFGSLVPSTRPFDSAVVLSQSSSYRPNWGTYRLRRARARRFLETAGCRTGVDGIYECADERLSLRMLTTAQFPRRTQTLEIIQRQLRAVGIETRLEYAPSRVLGQVLTRGDLDVVLLSWLYGGTFGPDEIFNCGAQFNFTGYCQRLVTRDLNDADAILDAERRAIALNRADRQLARDVPVIPLFQIPIYGVARSTVKGFAPYQQVRTWNAEDWWLDD